MIETLNKIFDVNKIEKTGRLRIDHTTQMAHFGHTKQKTSNSYESSYGQVVQWQCSPNSPVMNRKLPNGRAE